MARFIRFPWATTGDKTPVPFDTDPGGAVSYAQGFGPDYEITPGDPGWKPVPRPETNALYADLTDNISQYQLNGAPDWHPATDNAGVAISYPLNAIVRHTDNLVYRSIVAANTVEPGTDPTKWVVDGVAGQATTTTAGLTAYATQAETTARVINNKAVTPFGLGALFDFLLNNPVFPEVTTNGGVFTLTNPAGNVRVAAGAQWVHRGAFAYTSVQTDLPTVASKTYHLRWDRVNGFALYDLANGSYNPSSVAETDVTFDTTYDSMLVARVVTNASNAATITPLVNKNVLRAFNTQRTSSARVTSGDGVFIHSTLPVTLNWSRTPTVLPSMGAARGSFTAGGTTGPEAFFTGTYSDNSGSETASVTRYISKVVFLEDTDNNNVTLTGMPLQTNQLFTA